MILKRKSKTFSITSNKPSYDRRTFLSLYVLSVYLIKE